jgi:hypothetical protein
MPQDSARIKTDSEKYATIEAIPQLCWKLAVVLLPSSSSRQLVALFPPLIRWSTPMLSRIKVSTRRREHQDRNCAMLSRNSWSRQKTPVICLRTSEASEAGHSNTLDWICDFWMSHSSSSLEMSSIPLTLGSVCNHTNPTLFEFPSNCEASTDANDPDTIPRVSTWPWDDFIVWFLIHSLFLPTL